MVHILLPCCHPPQSYISMWLTYPEAPLDCTFEGICVKVHIRGVHVKSSFLLFARDMCPKFCKQLRTGGSGGNSMLGEHSRMAIPNHIIKKHILSSTLRQNNIQMHLLFTNLHTINMFWMGRFVCHNLVTRYLSLHIVPFV